MALDAFTSIYQAEGLSWLYVTVDSADHLDAVVARIEEILGEIADVFAPTNAAAFERTTAQAIQVVAQVGTWLAFALMLIVVFFSMLLVVRERAREIGTLKVLGASNTGVVIQFLSEAVALTLVSGVVGALRFHCGELTVSVVWQAGQVVLLGVSPLAMSVWQTALFLSILFHHSHMRLPLWLER